MEIRTTSGEVNMNNVRKEIRDLIIINEKIQSALVNGDRITVDEVMLIRQCASELLQKIPEPAELRRRPPLDGRQGITDEQVDAAGRP